MQDPVPPHHTRSYQSLGGPTGLPIVGNAFQVQRSSFHQQLEAWAQRYGDTFRFRIGARRFIAVRNPDVVAWVLRQRPDTFKKSARLEQVSKDLGFHGVFSANGEAWRRQRPVVLAGLDPAHVRAFLPAIQEVTHTLRARWMRCAQAGTPIDLLGDLMRYTVDVTTALAFGRNLDTLKSETDDVIQKHLNHILPELFKRILAPVDFYRWADWKTQGHVKALRKAVDEFVMHARGQLHADPALRERPRNLIQAMLAANEREDAKLSNEEVAGNVLTMLLAGEDTTANTLAWLTWLLHRNPDACERARAEVLEVLAGAPVASSVEQLSNLRVLEACAQEAMRLKPVAPIMINEAAQDTVVDGVAIPKGALVLCMMRAAGVSAEHFPAPLEFDPTRWLEGHAAAAGLSSPKRVVMPFGAGPRMCPGRYLALAEIKMVASMLLASFELEEVACEGGAEPPERLALTMSPVGLRMRLRPREMGRAP